MQEKILIIAVKKAGQKEDRFRSSVEELISLCHTAGGQVVKVMTQTRNKIHPATYIGEGKKEEIRAQVEELAVDLVISNDELSPVQLRNLSSVIPARIIDRSQLILDIFAARAKTKEGKLQVELAQLEYLLPRLQGYGTSLSRLGGGIGTRGPGETKLEMDRRYLRNRIHDIKQKLQTVVKQRELYRKRRKSNQVLQIALVGYTNAGKSTLFNQLTKSDTLEEDKLFATLDPLTRKVQLPSGFQGLMTDTVGFLQDLPTALIAAFRSTLEETKEADLLLHVVDSSHPDYVQHQETVLQLLKDLKADHLPMLTVYNKKDLLHETFIPNQHPAIVISAFDNDDIQKLLKKIEELLKQEWHKYALTLKQEEMNKLYSLEKGTMITEKYFDEDRNAYVIRGFSRSPIQNDDTF